MKKIGEETKTGQINDPAKRFDLGKARWDLIPDDVLEKIAEIYTHGALKYGEENWRKGMKWKRCIGSLKRHTKAFTIGQDIDPESKCYHLGQIIWNAMTLLWYQLEQVDGDNRVKTYTNEEFMIKCKDDIERQIIMFWENYANELKEKQEKENERTSETPYPIQSDREIAKN